eukprot:scaffold1954_cov268-Pinguiococcus_pyrenoidosus.AAC.83
MHIRAVRRAGKLRPKLGCTGGRIGPSQRRGAPKKRPASSMGNSKVNSRRFASQSLRTPPHLKCDAVVQAAREPPLPLASASVWRPG